MTSPEDDLLPQNPYVPGVIYPSEALSEDEVEIDAAVEKWLGIVDPDDEGEEETTEEKPSSDILDDLLAESMQAYQAGVKAKKGQRLTKAEKAVVQYQEAERNWTAVSLVGLVQKETCRCGHIHTTFIGWYGVLQHKNDCTVRRLTKVSSVLDPISYLTVPTTKYTVFKQVDVCGCCLDFPDAEPEQALEWGLHLLK